jgi:hypothetical protein
MPASPPPRGRRPVNGEQADAASAVHVGRHAGSSSMSRTLVDVRPVVNRREWTAFLDLPARLHRNDPNWVDPLRYERRALWSPNHPWFAHGRGRLWLAYIGDRAVGSISAQIDSLYAETWGEDVGYFGQLEAENDPEVFGVLVETATRWLRAEGCTRVQGPFDLGVNQSCGLLVEGHDTPPMLMMGHSPPYYAERLEGAGFRRATDLFAYLLATDFAVPRAMARVIGEDLRQVRFRPFDRRRSWQDLQLMREIYNDAWAKNWGYVPFTADEFDRVGHELKPVLRPGYVQIAEVRGEPAGFIVALPNVNELIRDLGGRLLPLVWARLLWRLKRGRVTTARVPLMGVKQQFQGWPLGAAVALGLIHRVHEPLRRDDVRQVELSWILEHNKPMRSLIEMLGAKPYKRYRIYEMELGRG